MHGSTSDNTTGSGICRPEVAYGIDNNATSIGHGRFVATARILVIGPRAEISSTTLSRTVLKRIFCVVRCIRSTHLNRR